MLIEAYAHAGDPDQAYGHFDNMKKAGLRPDDRCTVSMMTAYVKKNLLDKALELLLNLQEEGFKPGLAINTVLVEWLGRLQHVEEAEQVLEEIKATGDAPFEIHVSLCDIYERSGNEKEARKSLKILEGRDKLLRADQFERIVSGLVAGGMVAEAKGVYDSMQSLGFSPSEPVMVALMAAQSFSRRKPRTRG